MKKMPISLHSKQNEVILWREFLDLGIACSLAELKKKMNERAALKELRESLYRHSEEHWKGLYDMLRKIR